MCTKCQGFAEKITFTQPYEFFDLIRQVRQVIAEGRLITDGGNCALDDIVRDKPWPADLIECYFRCVCCNQRFSLSAETYHGSGGSWQVLNV